MMIRVQGVVVVDTQISRNYIDPLGRNRDRIVPHIAAHASASCLLSPLCTTSKRTSCMYANSQVMFRSTYIGRTA